MKKAFLPIILSVLLLTACGGGKKSLVIGVSQCSDDIWRTKLNEELSLAAGINDVRLVFSSADDDSQRQMAQIRKFVKDGVDLLIVSPNQSHTITPAVEEAYDAGIPVILFDRKIDSPKYTAFIGADNVEVGRIMGQFIADYLGGKGKVVEIQGLEGSSPADDRHRGFKEALDGYPGISLLASPYGGWLQENAFDAMRAVMADGIRPDAVFGQNDRMALGARDALGHPEDISFFGVDALPDAGLQDVIDGVLTASYLYPTRGDLVMDLAMRILRGDPFERETLLESALVDSHNAGMLKMQEEEVANQRAMVQDLSGKLDTFLLQYNTQRIIMWMVIAVAILLVLIAGQAYWGYTNSRRLNAELMELSRQLEENTRAKLDFFTNVSHDLRTPLSLVAGPLEHVLEGPLQDDQKQTLMLARRNVDILRRLVNNILDFRKIESGNMPLTLYRFDLPSAVKEWMSGFDGTSRTIRYDGTGSLEVEADMRLLECILFNLLGNSIKHTSPEGEITVSVQQEGADAILTVKDNGEGIPREKLPYIFDRFYQAGKHTSGTGIGLALVKGIAELHGGSVSVESAPGEGATFFIRIPIRHEGAEILESRDAAEFTERFQDVYRGADTSLEEAASSVTESDRPTILVVDDNSDLREFIGTLLQGEYRIIKASDGKEALDKATRELPDLVVSDVMMPVMDGLGLCKALKGQFSTSHIPVILLTAKSLEEQRAEGYDSGADAYISKPFSEKVLLSRIGNLLKSRILLKEHYLETGESASRPQENDFLSRFRAKVQEHISDENLSVEQIGSEIGLSRVQLYRKVKALTGYSPVELVRITRLKAAAEMLKTTDKTISEIAYAVGFGTPSYFSKCFKELFGRQPGEGR
ncbi:MAG: substrate-binding domain-containing protein [Bacteroidales bacterium]|nr:substrate-binding domain-containing protein [Bacteroidales bacterium]